MGLEKPAPPAFAVGQGRHWCALDDMRRRHLGIVIAAEGAEIDVLNERRNMQRRADVLRTTIEKIVRNPDAAVTTSSAAEVLRIPEQAAARIIARLVASGVLTNTGRGVWVRHQWRLAPRSRDLE